MRNFVLVAAIASMLVAGNCHAQDNIWTGLGGDTKWENGANWESGLPPMDPNLEPDDNGGTVRIDGDFDVLYDADTWQWVIDSDQLNTAGPDAIVGGVNLNTQHWGNGRLFMGVDASVTGTNTFTLDPGGDNPVNVPANGSNIIGQQTGADSTINVLSGAITLGGGGNNAVSLGISEGSSGTINVSGGTLVLTRSQFLIAADRFGVSRAGTGTFNISGGAFRNRTDVTIGLNGTFNVEGSAPTEVGVGSAFSGDGEWFQATGGTLRTGLDAGGITPILIDDVDDDGNGAQGNVIFEAGAILDPYDAGGGTNEVATVMIWEGTLTDNGLVLSQTAIDDGWTFQIVGNELQVQNLSLPDAGAVLLGDIDLSGDVNFSDISPFIALLSGPTFQAEGDFDGNGIVNFDDISGFISALSSQ